MHLDINGKKNNDLPRPKEFREVSQGYTKGCLPYMNELQACAIET